MKYLMIITFLFLVSLPTLAYEFGIDRLREPEIITKLQGKNLAVLTHAAAKTKNGVHLIDEEIAAFKKRRLPYLIY